MTPAEFTSIASSLRPRLLSLGRSFFGDAEPAEDAVQRRQHKGIVVPLVQQSAPEVSSSVTASDLLHEHELREALSQAIGHLRPSERRLWIMFAEAQMDAAQIAAATGIGVRTVSSMLSSARNKIKNELKKGGIV